MPETFRSRHKQASKRKWGVFPHSIDKVSTGRGYVPREVDANNEPMDYKNYGGVKPVKVYASLKAAERHADSLS